MDIKIIIALLRQDAALLQLVSDSEIVAGDIAQDALLPAIGVKHLGGRRRAIAGQPSNGTYCTATAQITVCATSYTQQKQVIKAVCKAMENNPGEIVGVVVDGIEIGADGPDLPPDGDSIYAQTQDVVIKYIDRS